MKAPADASNGRGLWSLPSTKNCHGRSATGELLSGGNGEGAGQEGGNIEAHKSASGIHKLFTCNLRCSYTSSSSAACSFPVIYRGRAYPFCEAAFDCGPRRCAIGADGRRESILGGAPQEHCPRRSLDRGRKTPPGVGCCSASNCSPAKPRLRTDATRSHRIVFTRALLPRDATRTSVASGHDPPT